MASTAENLAVLEALLPDGLHPTLCEMAMHAYLHLIEDEPAMVEQLGLQRIAELVIGQIDRIAIEVGGGQFYLPKGIGARLSQRDEDIARRYNGRNRRELAREYGLTEMRIDQIVKAVRLAKFHQRQGRLDLTGF